MNWLSIGDLLARHSDKRIATAADARVEAVEALRAGVVPDDPDVRAEAVEVRGRIETAITDATSEVESAVALCYELPLEPPPLLKRLVGDRALFHLHGDTVPEDLESRRTNSLSLLKAIRAGERLLIGEDGTALRRRPRVRTTSGEAVFSGSGGTLEGY